MNSKKQSIVFLLIGLFLNILMIRGQGSSYGAVGAFMGALMIPVFAGLAIGAIGSLILKKEFFPIFSFIFMGIMIIAFVGSLV